MINAIRSTQYTFVQRSPVYYGWVVWLVATLGLIATSPGQSFSVSLFFDFFIDDFGLDRTTVSGLYGIGTFIGSLSLVWVGRQIDHFGNRKITAIIVLLFALVLVLWSFVTGPIGLLVGFIAIRGLGQGSLSLSSSTVIAQWFERRRGRMMSMTIVAFALFQSWYILWLEDLLNTHDWREVWIILGICVAALILPISLLLLRNRPEDFGLLPDGDTELVQATQPQSTTIKVELENSWTLREAMGTAIFWVFVIGRLLPPAWGTGMILHQISLFEGLGYDSSVATATFSQFTLIMAAMAIAFGWMIDRYRPGVILAIQMAAMALSMGMAMVMTDRWMVIVYAVAFGVVMGSGGVFDGSVWVNMFGRLHQGAIRGFVTTSMVAASALGPVVFGISFDYLGGYNPILAFGIALAVPAMIFALWVKKPQR